MAQGFPNIPGFSSWGDMTNLIQAQNRLLEQLPSTLRRLTEVLERLAPAANDAVETVANSRRITERVEQVMDELEDPIRSLVPTIERLNALLADPAIAAIPATADRIQNEVNPMLDRLTPTADHAVEVIATSRRVTDRIEVVIGDLEQPVRDLIPAIERLTAMLNDPAVLAIPATVARVQEEFHPMLDRLGAMRRGASSAGQKGRNAVDLVVDRFRTRPVDPGDPVVPVDPVDPVD